MKLAKSFGLVLARFCMSGVFLASGMSKILHWQSQESNMYRVLSEWQVFVGYLDPLSDLFSILTPWAPLILIFSTMMEFVGGLMILLGIKEKIGALLLILFLIPTTVIMHQFWFVEGIQREVEISHFLKNLAILGGLFLFLINGSQESKTATSSLSPLKFG